MIAIWKETAPPQGRLVGRNAVKCGAMESAAAPDGMFGKLAVPSSITTPGVVEVIVAVTPVNVTVPSLLRLTLKFTCSPASQVEFAFPGPPVPHVSATDV